MKNKKSIVEGGATQADLGINQLRASSTVLFLALQQVQGILSNVSTTLAVLEKNITIAGKEVKFLCSISVLIP